MFKQIRWGFENIAKIFPSFFKNKCCDPSLEISPDGFNERHNAHFYEEILNYPFYPFISEPLKI